MVKVTVEFEGKNMTQIRADMERWAKGFLGGEALDFSEVSVAPPRQRSFAEEDVQLDFMSEDDGA
jgi:hypothetical protein